MVKAEHGGFFVGCSAGLVDFSSIAIKFFFGGSTVTFLI
jgi:hypothetical protein